MLLFKNDDFMRKFLNFLLHKNNFYSKKKKGNSGHDESLVVRIRFNLIFTVK